MTDEVPRTFATTATSATPRVTSPLAAPPLVTPPLAASPRVASPLAALAASSAYATAEKDDVPRTFTATRKLLGTAVQADPMKPKLKAPGPKRLKLYHEKLSAFKRCFQFQVAPAQLGKRDDDDDGFYLAADAVVGRCRLPL